MMVVRVTFSLRFDPCEDIAPAELLHGRTDPLQKAKAASFIQTCHRVRSWPAVPYGAAARWRRRSRQGHRVSA
ncbi:hypothetical protein B0W47_04650 [Komagataeibacter nataicola]|uniref:Uncharacterized protein n=1 Tax=Komagataeibacter nataicola TaxID=265960 RepID=A0A9N7CKH0_9PROT|nr:hypothetical protein B0W47_04650 [Komagataeibacter nataicola]PYD67890.1 hypothetical protein CDI09_00705 [Komagataeibacter nataicola]